MHAQALKQVQDFRLFRHLNKSSLYAQCGTSREIFQNFAASDAATYNLALPSNREFFWSVLSVKPIVMSYSKWLTAQKKIAGNSSQFCFRVPLIYWFQNT